MQRCTSVAARVAPYQRIRDLVVVDECHRGSARDESNWREILDYFQPAHQLGMTATPLREDNRDTYIYFGGRMIKEGTKWLAQDRLGSVKYRHDGTTGEAR